MREQSLKSLEEMKIAKLALNMRLYYKGCEKSLHTEERNA